MRNIFLISICAALGGGIFAQSMNMFQQGTSAPAQAAPAPVQAAPASGVTPAKGADGTPSMGIFESSFMENFSDKVFDVNSDSFDLDNGSVNWKGKTFNIGNSRVVRARFERYLSMPVDSQNLGNYKNILNEISAALAANNDDISSESIRAAWGRLFDAAEYEIDGDSSLIIANLVYLSWRMRDEYNIARAGETNKERDMLATRTQFKEQAAFLEYAADKINSKKRNFKMTRTEGTTELGHRLQDLQKEVAELAAAKAVKEATAFKSVVQFQSQAVAFMLERKFQQAQMASMFYRHIYRGNAQELQVGRDQLKDFFQVSNFVPTLDMIETLSRDAAKDIRAGVLSVNSLYDSGERYGALQRLMETFFLGEYDINVITFDPEKKKVLHRIYRNASTIKDLADARDWAGIEAVIEEIKKDANDFPYREILSKVKMAQRASEMHVMAAKQAAALGRIDDVKASLSSAMEIWPLNPAIQSFNEDLVGLTSGASKYFQKFDELMGRRDYRSIYAEAPEYGMALRTDEERAAALRDIVTKVSTIDMLIAQAEEFGKQNNPYFAWDILEKARAIDEDDPVLARSFAKLAPEVADYVKALRRAGEAESRKEYANALTYYLAAQDIFPASQACRQGIERVAPKYLD